MQEDDRAEETIDLNYTADPEIYRAELNDGKAL